MPSTYNLGLFYFIELSIPMNLENNEKHYRTDVLKIHIVKEQLTVQIKILLFGSIHSIHNIIPIISIKILTFFPFIDSDVSLSKVFSKYCGCLCKSDTNFLELNNFLQPLLSLYLGSFGLDSVFGRSAVIQRIGNQNKNIIML